MNNTPIVAVMAAALAAGCASPYTEAPLATNFPTSKQEKLQAAAHWNRIAQDVAQRIAKSLPNQSPLYVREPNTDTAFARAFHGQLITALLAAGHPVMKTPQGALQVEVDTQAVAFSSDRPQYRHAGAATALGGGLWALYDIGRAVSPGAAGMVALAAGDTLAWFQSEFASGETPQTEIIVTTSVSNDSQYVARNTSVYYVADSDRRLYRQTDAQTKNFHVVGGK